MTKKQRVYNFLENLTDVTLNEAWLQFSSKPENADIAKPSFSSYRSNAISDGVFTPATKSVVSTKKRGTTVPTQLNNKVAEYKKIDIDNVDMKNFVTLPTGTAFDLIASKRDALMASTSYIITGESGAGKTTIAVNIADYIMEQDPTKTAGFVSCEMDEFDWTEECLDNPRLGNIPTIFMLDYLDADNYVEILTDSMKKFDYVILDSFEVIIDQLKDIKGWTGKKAESELINMMRIAASESGTCVMAIQQYTKGGTFVGSNKIKHMLTGMIFVRFDNNGERYVEFTKNRRGGSKINRRVYFTKCEETGRLLFDGERYKKARELESFKKEESENIKEEDNIFDEEILVQAKKRQEERERALELMEK